MKPIRFFPNVMLPFIILSTNMFHQVIVILLEDIILKMEKYPSGVTRFDFCFSTLTLKYDQAKLVEGVRGRQFVGDETMFDNGQTVAEQACFCEGECQPPGVRNLTRCRQGAPVFVSFPHFYKADPSYTAAVDGLAPNKSLHEFRITLEPVSRK